MHDDSASNACLVNRQNDDIQTGIGTITANGNPIVCFVMGSIKADSESPEG